jgi:hypothetical protein
MRGEQLSGVGIVIAMKRMVQALSLLTAIVMAAIGFGLAYFGYEIAQKLLALAGLLGGIVAGLAVGTFGAPIVLEGSISPGVTIILAIIGAILGRIFVPAVSKVAFGLVGFVMTSVAVLAFLSQGRILDVFLNAIPPNLAYADPASVLNRIAASPLFRDPNFGQALLLAVGAGVVGGLLALKLYDEFVAVATTVVGASMLGLAIPILIEAARGSTVTAGAGEFSFIWFGITLVTGLIFEFSRNKEVDFL